MKKKEKNGRSVQKSKITKTAIIKSCLPSNVNRLQCTVNEQQTEGCNTNVRIRRKLLRSFSGYQNTHIDATSWKHMNDAISENGKMLHSQHIHFLISDIHLWIFVR